MRKKPLQCPFCDNLLARPIELDMGTLELTGGICRCRAVYVLDRTGHNLGEAFLDAITFLCRGDIDRALSLNPAEYETEDFDYDVHSNTGGRNTAAARGGKIIFARLKNP